jgi:hypothetical protein
MFQMLPHKIRSRTSRQRILLSPSVTTSTQVHIEASAAPDAFNSETVSLSRSLKAVITKSSEAGGEQSPLHQKLRSYHAAVELLVEGLPSLRWFFSDLATVIDTILAEARDSNIAVVAKSQHIDSMEKRLEDAFEKVRMMCTDEIKQTLVVTGQRDSEIQAVSDLCEMLTNRVKTLETENSDLRRSMKRMVSRDAEHDKESDMRRSQLSELQAKSLVIVQENQYLRQICRHNRDLLDEASELRDEIDRINASHKLETDKLTHERGSFLQEIENLTSALRHVGKQLEINERDLIETKETVALCESELQQSTNRQQFFLGSHTPRPSRTVDMTTVVQSARGTLGEVTSQRILPGSTATIESTLLQLVAKLNDFAQQQKSKAEAQAAVLQFLAFDDFEQLSRGVASSLASFCGSGALPHGAETLLQTLAPTPLHSRVVLGQGAWHEASSLRYEPLCIGGGWIGIRTLSLEELILALDEIRSDRRQPNYQSGTLVQHVRRYALQRNSSSPTAQNEFLASMDYSLDLHCYSPVVDLFRRTLRDNAFPESLHSEIISALDFLCKEVSALPTEFLHTGAIGKTPVRFLSRKALNAAVAKAFPGIGDSAAFRLRAVLQAEMMRLAAQDAKVVSAIVAKDECIAETVLGSPVGDDITSPFVVVTGTAQRMNQSTPFRRPQSSLLMPFSAALYRFAVDQYESFTLVFATAGCSVAQEGKLTCTDLRAVLKEIIDDSGVVDDFFAFCRQSHSESEIPVPIFVKLTRSFYFPPHTRAKGELPPVAADVKVVDAARKSVVTLRSLQR